MTTINRQFVEKVLDNKATSYAGAMLILPFLLAVILLGTISYTVGKQTAPLIEKILTPPKVVQQEEVSFEDLAPEMDNFQTNFEEFKQNEVELFSIPDAAEADNIPEIEPVRDRVKTEVAMSETPDGQAWESDTPNVDLPAATLRDPSVQMTTRDDSEDLDATMRHAAGAAPVVSPTGQGAADQPGGAALGKDKSGDVEADEGLEKTVVINRGQRNAGEGAGLNKPASQEKRDLTGWILGHPRSLPPAVAEALDYSRQKADRTSTGSAVDENGKLYQFYFLHRTQNNLLRILVVLGSQAYRIDLPDFYLEANHVKAGRVFRGPAPDDDPFAPGPVIEVALESVSSIPGEVPDMFQLVLDWLEIKGQE